MTDYEEIVSGTVDEVKDEVRDSDLNPEKVLEAEREGKDRKTLTEWLENRVEREAEESEAPSGFFDAPRNAFVAGLVTGVLVLGAVVFAMGGPAAAGGVSGTVASQQVSTTLESYITDNAQALRLPADTEVSVRSVQRHQETGMYNAAVDLTMPVRNRTVEQTATVFTTSDGRFVFFAEPLDMTEPVPTPTIGG